MRKIPKILKTALLLFVTLLLATNCSNEYLDGHDYGDTHNHSLKIVRKKFEELIKEKKFRNAYEKIQKNKNNSMAQKTVMEQNYGFEILDIPAKVIETSNTSTYTFQISRDSVTSDDYFENLIVFVDSLNQTSAFIAKYQLNKNAPILENYVPIKSVDVTEIVYNNGQFNAKMTEFFCVTFFASKCTGIPYDCGGGICGFQEETICTGGGGGGGVSTGGLFGGGTVPTNGGSGSNNPITNPVYEGGTSSAASSNPCEKFKKQKDELPALSQALINLEATKTQNHENGIYVTTNSPDIQNAIPSNTAGYVNFPDLAPPHKYKVMAHTHDAYGPLGTGSLSIFSWEDILNAVAIVRDDEADDDFFTFYLATADNTRYALTINNSLAFVNAFNVIDPNNPNVIDTEKADKLSKIEAEFYSEEAKPGKISYTSNPTDDLKIFLKMMKKLNLPVSLFEVDPTYTVFKQLTLASNGTVTKGNPCNQ